MECQWLISASGAYMLIPWVFFEIRVSAWTWSATLLQSSTAAYTFGWFIVFLGIHLLILPQASVDHGKSYLLLGTSQMSTSVVLKVVWRRWNHSSVHVRHGRIQSKDERKWCAYVLGDSQSAVWNRRPHSLHILRFSLHPDRLRVIAPLVLSTFWRLYSH